MRPTFVDPGRQADLDRDGFVVIPFLPLDEVDHLLATFDRLGPGPGDVQKACESSFHSHDRPYKLRVDGALRPLMTPHLDTVFDRQRALPFNYIVKWPGGLSGFGLHPDLSLVDERHHRSVEVWVALTPTTELNGAIWMVPGSHRWMPTLRGIHRFPNGYEGVAKRVIDRHAVPILLEAGEAVVFDHATLHFSPPNRTDRPRVVAISDLIPEEADHIAYFGGDDGDVYAYRIDDSYWTDNSPFTLWKPPPRSSLLGKVDFEFQTMTDERLDQLVADGLATESGVAPKGALNPAKAWCHRCGEVDFEGGPTTDRWIGNVTVLCAPCRDIEATMATTPGHVGG